VSLMGPSAVVPPENRCIRCGHELVPGLTECRGPGAHCSCVPPFSFQPRPEEPVRPTTPATEPGQPADRSHTGNGNAGGVDDAGTSTRSTTATRQGRRT
jgi:hypothetical protein